MTKAKRLQTKDYILIGIFSILIYAVNAIVGSILTPVIGAAAMPLIAGFCLFFSAIVYLVMAMKVAKRGALLVQSIVNGLVYTLMGVPLMLVFFALAGLFGETDALKAFESVMKTICKRKGWQVAENATAKPLINTLFQNGLLSVSLQTQCSSLRDTLESGLPTIRNKNSGHGQGENVINLPPHMVAYALHLAATNILFLIESYRNSNK